MRVYGMLAPLLMVTSGCMIHKVETNRKPPINMPGSFVQGAGKTTMGNTWWSQLQDPGFDAYVTVMLRQNLDLGAGFARMKHMLAIAKKAGAGHYPQIQADVGASYSQSAFYGGSQFGDQVLKTSRFPINASVSYEVDLWGKVSSAKRAAALNVVASREDISALSISLVGTAAELWFLIREQLAHKALVGQQLKVNQTYLDLVSLRFDNGLATALDVLQQRQQVAAVKVQFPPIDATLQVTRHQLDVLAGRSPGTGKWLLKAGLPPLPPLPATGAPIDVLKRRPDVRAAQLRVLSADYQVGVAVADRLPALRLKASGGSNAQNVTDVFGTWVFNLIGGLVAPLFDGGRRSAEVMRTKAVLEESIQGYGKAVLAAFHEVEDALAQEKYQREGIRALGHQLTLARKTLDEARHRYFKGLTSYLAVLTALKSVQALERQELGSRRQLWSYRIKLYRALGGDWPKRLTHRNPKKASKRDSKAKSRPVGGKK